MINNAARSLLCEQFIANNTIDPKLYDRYVVKRGLRNSDGTGVMAGLTNICNVHGYVVNEGEKSPIQGQLIFRGYNINDLVSNAQKENRFGYEEIVYLLLMGDLPNREELTAFKGMMAENRPFPDNFFEDMILKAPSKNIMNKMARAILALYSYDDNPENRSPEYEMATAISIISKLPNIMVSLHAEHGGGNNSTFACRVLTSSGTDPYSAYSAAIGSLKGPRHGGANLKVAAMHQCIKDNVQNWEDEGEIADFLTKILNKEAFDHTGLVYGMGHAVYTLSDPRAVILRENAKKMAENTEFEREYKLLETVERLTPELFKKIKGSDKAMCANVDMYSGFVYSMLGIPEDLYTPMFAVSRMAGWCAHRFEELVTGKRIIRPAYKAISGEKKYIPLDER